jgi:hypothetical protein
MLDIVFGPKQAAAAETTTKEEGTQ